MQQFGKWLITTDGIEWTGGVKYLIDKNTLNEESPDDTARMYDWLLHLTEKTWLTRDDIYALNSAFIYALDHFGVGFNPEISFAATLTEQDRLMKEKEEPQENEITL